MPASHSLAPLNAWFTLRGDFVGVSGVPVQLVPGQQVDPAAWYTADGRQAAVAGPFRPEAMNRQGYLLGAQIIAAEKMQREVNKGGRTSQATARPVPPAGPAEAGLKLVDWASMTVGGSGTAVQLAEWDRVKQVVEAGEEVAYWRSRRTGRWYQVSRQPNGITGPRNPTLRAARRFAKAGHVCFILGSAISIYQGQEAYYSIPKNSIEAEDRRNKMNKAGLDFAMGVVGLFGPLGFAISTVYFIVDTGVSLGTNGKNNITDSPHLLFGPRAESVALSWKTPQELVLESPIDNTRVQMPRRIPQRTMADILNQTPIAGHNAVFKSASIKIR